MVQLKHQTYARYLYEQYHRASEGTLTDFVSRKRGQLYLDDQINLNQLARRYGTPLEVVYYPQITRQVERMRAWANHARWKSRYDGQFHYAYATKANFTADVVQTALAAGVQYETSAGADVEIARHLWRQGILPEDRLVVCNGSKEEAYINSIVRLRHEGCTNVIPVLDDVDELAALTDGQMPFQFGVRERAAGNRDGMHLGNERFGLMPDEIDQVVQQLEESPHTLVLYHAMVGTQVAKSETFLAMLRDSVVAYCCLRQRVPTLRYFDFGGGMPTSGYQLDFDFDYQQFLIQLMDEIQTICASFGIPVPDLIGEFGRYTTANHSVYLFEVGRVKHGLHEGDPDWYLVNGSLMVNIPDMVLVDDQQFVILPLNGWDNPVQPVRLAGRHTCDSDDIYPQPSQAPLMLPAPSNGDGLVVAIFGVGAYQKMLSGFGGVHHCLSPELPRVIIKDIDGERVVTSVPQQDQAAMMRLLGYQPEPMAVSLRHVGQRMAS